MSRVFGQATGKRRYDRSRYQKQFGGNNSRREDRTNSKEETLAKERAQYRRKKHAEWEQSDINFGYERYSFHTKGKDETRRGWLFNILTTTIPSVEASSDKDATPGSECAALDLFFRTETGSTFKSSILFCPYFYVIPSLPTDKDDFSVFFESLQSSMLRLYEDFGLFKTELVNKVDLDQVNHLSPSNRNGRPMIKLIFGNVQQLMEVRKRVQEVVAKNSRRKNISFEIFNPEFSPDAVDPLSTLLELREYDVPYLVRACTDLDIRAGAWYTVKPNATDIGVTLSDQDVETKADPTYMAFDIECTKAPLKFPDSKVDSIFMISYMVDGKGYLIISRHIVSEDVKDFEYSPKPNYPGPFHIFNEVNEKELLKRFFIEYQKHRPQIVVTYNGDFFDWPFLEERAAFYGMNIAKEVGVEKLNGGEYRGRCSVHLDAFHWVQRDSYLPQGAQGLKAVTKYKLGYDPVEVDPEDMVRFAQERPVHMATYSVSDAVATYYLYEKYVHLFIFSLCTIIPMGPEDVLRKGSGTLCETLLMVQACSKDIICPNKQKDPLAKFHNGHLLESETYIGGKVECLETGVYRSDIEYDFSLKPNAFQMLINNIDRDLAFAIEVELGGDRSQVINYDEVRSEIVEQLEMLRDRPKRREKPYIYHLDVGAMYPNIILTNRLQPSAIVDDATCAACDFNQIKNGCKRRMEWVWRGDLNPASRNEYNRTKDQLSKELVDGEQFLSLPESKQEKLVSDRLKTYSRNVYRKTKITEEVTRKDTVCMRENDFYVETVRRFRDRRYELKKLTKIWKKRIESASDTTGKKSAEDRALIYDSLQVAHKCILNSFYGYVMRKGARWRSMEMAGIVTKTGADLITQARILVEQIGRPLELDTDGIWCILPQSFPDVYTFKTSGGGSLKLEYPCVMLNADVHDNFTNHQYQTLKNPELGLYETRTENSIFFEVDGPYRCMVLPSSTEEGKLLKKRYAVFNFDGSLAELKGFELKRRGELELIKTFQSQVFERFLDGNSLEQCYQSVSEVANHWIDVLDTQGESLETDELIDLISENRNMSRQLEDYGNQKGTSQTTARRLGEFLGAEIIKDKGLNCKFIIAEQPYGAPVTERAIPTAIWMAERAVMKHYLRKWLKAPGLEGEAFDIRNILDWEYYTDRLAKTIQKIITIPAALQMVDNPVPRVPHPNWLSSKMRQFNDNFQQVSISAFLQPAPSKKKQTKSIVDIEDIGMRSKDIQNPTVHRPKQRIQIERSSEAKERNGTEESCKVIDPKERVNLSDEKFSDWLNQKKMLWRSKWQMKKQRKNQPGVFRKHSNAIKVTSRKNYPVSSMEGYVREKKLALFQEEWHVIEIREMGAIDRNRVTSSGDFTLWIMIGTGTLQKVQLTVPRKIYVSSATELKQVLNGKVQIKQVDKHLPHNDSAAFIYEISLPEHIYKSNKWIELLKPKCEKVGVNLLDKVYETSHPLLLRVMSELGCIIKAKSSLVNSTGRRAFQLNELQRVNENVRKDYLEGTNQKRIFFYYGINQKSKTGIVAIFMVEDSPKYNIENGDEEEEWKDPDEKSAIERQILMSTVSFWIVKPGSNEGAQRGVTKKQCQYLFSQLLGTIHSLATESEKDGLVSDYRKVSPLSRCYIDNLKFVDNEAKACVAANDFLNSKAKGNHGPTFLVLNSTKANSKLRRSIPGLNLFPNILLPFPPGFAHDPSKMKLPSLNWEQPVVQAAMEAYFYMIAVSYPKRIEFSRYGQIPIGNLGKDEFATLYDVSLSRQLMKYHALSWANPINGSPDLGVPVCKITDTMDALSEMKILHDNDIWGNENSIASPVVCNPGSYRTVCIEVEVHNLAIAAFSNVIENENTVQLPNSPKSVSMFGTREDGFQLSNEPLGDEMSTSISLPLLRSVFSSWMRDAFVSNCHVADDMLHHLYELVSSPKTLLSDPALHRCIHSMMKKTFLRLLGEFQRLGCTIVYGSFHKIIVSTNKVSLSQAEEYIKFVISTIRNKSIENGSGGIEKVTLDANRYYCHILFYDEYNYGGIELEHKRDGTDVREDTINKCFGTKQRSLNPTVITGWSMRNYLGSEIAQEYFRVIIARFSKDLFKKEQQLKKQGKVSNMEREIITYKRKVVSRHFASDLSRALDEIIKENRGPECFPKIPGSFHKFSNPALEFVKSITTVLSLDTDVLKEVQALKSGLLAQLGVAEYSKLAEWRNPCASFVLADVFCIECQGSRDLNLCELPPFDNASVPKRHWTCENCGSPYDADIIEHRLMDIVRQYALRYQMQDLRCSKTNRVSMRALAKQSHTSAELDLDTTRYNSIEKIRILHHLAHHHELEWLKEMTNDLLS